MKNLIPVEWSGQRVLTTPQVAEGLNCSLNLINKHFSNRKAGFVEGVHFFFLKGEAFKAFKKVVNEIHPPDSPHRIGKFVTNIKLWTYQGVARVSKLIDTPEAWELFKELEEVYFGIKKSPYQSAQIDSAVQERLDALEGEVAGLKLLFEDRLESIQKQLTPAERADKLIALAEKIQDETIRDKTLSQAVNLILGKKIF